jgi:hypothetical protein
MTLNPVAAEAISSTPLHFPWKWLISILLGYAFLYDNSNSLPIVAGYDWTRLLEIPREIRNIEIEVVTCCTLLLLSRREASQISRRLFWGCSAFFLVGIFSYLHNMVVGFVDFGRLCYSYVLPILIFIIGREAPLGMTDRKWILNLFLLWVLISAIVSWYQFIILGYPIGDDVSGLNKDAHVNGNLLAFAALILTSYGLVFQKFGKIILAILAVITLILSSVLKTNIFMIIAFAILAIKIGRVGKAPKPSVLNRRMVLSVVLISLLLVSGYVAFMYFDLLSKGKMGPVIMSLLKNPTRIGPISAQIGAFKIVGSNFTTFLFGTGPFSYGNPITMGQTLEGGPLANFLSSFLLGSLGESGESGLITLTTALLVEFGFLAFITWVILYAAIFRSVWRCSYSADQLNLAYAAGLIGCFLIMLLTAATALFGGLDSISVSWPVMFLAGITCRIEVENQA